MNKTVKTIGCIALAFVFCFLAIGYAMVQDELTVNGSLSVDGEPLLDDTALFFESDYLKASNETPKYTVYGDTVDIHLFNFDSLNNVTAEAISYAMTLEGADAAIENMPTSASPGTMAGGEDTTVTHTLNYTGNVDAEITVRVTATLGAQTKTMTATFVFAVEEPSTSYSVTDHGTYVVVDIFTTSTDPITVSYGSNLAPDNTNDLMRTWYGQTAGTITGLVPHTHYELVFFKAEASITYVKQENVSLTDSSITIAQTTTTP